MTLATMMKLALRQLDEPTEDLSEYEELFRSYANMGYMIALRLFYKPRMVIDVVTDELGDADIGGLGIARVVNVRDGDGSETIFAMDEDGITLHTGALYQCISVLGEIECPTMLRGTDEPMLPEYAQPALVDYICYRHLMNGNSAKQSRAMAYYQQFTRAMQEIEPQGKGSTTRFKNLYAVTGFRKGW
jgi:hypothetical protein